MDHEKTLESSPESLVRLRTARRAVSILLGIPDNHITQIDVFGSMALDLMIMRDIYFEDPSKLPDYMQKYLDDIKREGVTIYKKQRS